MIRLLLILLFSACSFIMRAQNLTDGLMMPKGDLCTGFLFGQDKWTDYWEGTLKRENGNIGAITTQSLTWLGNYGVTNKLNVIAMIPYVKTKASQGVLSGMEGIQDLSLGVKYNFLKTDVGPGSLRMFVVGTYSAPLTDYTPDFLPLSIGLGAQQLSARFTTYYKFNKGFYFTGTTAYTLRSNIKLDRAFYYTDGQFYSTNEVDMPNVYDFSLSGGFLKGPLNVFGSYTQQVTLGGGDIRRQDMPFASNQMNFSKVDATVMYYLPKPKGLAVRGIAGYTVAGRNVGQSTYFMGGLLYTLHFIKSTDSSN
jgi:hypothetical protein